MSRSGRAKAQLNKKMAEEGRTLNPCDLCPLLHCEGCPVSENYGM